MSQKSNKNAYQPTPLDIAWTKNMLQLLKTEATWAVPCCDGVYKVNKTEKKLTLIKGSFAGEMQDRIVAVFESLGWEVLDGTSQN